MVVVLCLQCAEALAQSLPDSDTALVRKLQFTRSTRVNKALQQVVFSMMKTHDDGSYLNRKSEDAYLPYQGKIIRNIDIETLSFDRSITDSCARDESLGARIGKRLHLATRKFVIRNNLFIKEGMQVNAYMVADNERFIRSLEYINDVRIYIDSIPGNPDSVDVRVYTKDLFSIGGGAGAQGVRMATAQLYDANLGGMGQRLELSGLYNRDRSPVQGGGAFYRKNNVGHTYIDATVGHSEIYVSPYTRAEESTDYLQLTRRLVSPYSRFAGALNVSYNRSYNLYNLSDSIFNKYRYYLLDSWPGYNIGIRQLTATNNTIRDRRFLALRYYQRDFREVPPRIGDQFSPVFNSSRAALAQFTFFRQDYYKTQYIYGFGTTEDLPYGYNVSLTGGVHEQLGIVRPYAGINASRYLATGRGGFVNVFMRTGGFLHQGKVQDASLLVGATAYSRLQFWNALMIRQYINFSYTHLHNRVTYAPLYINNYYGLQGFLSDSAYGTRRLSLQLETVFYFPFKVLGFQVATFPWANLSLITPENVPVDQARLYSALGAGIRTRNENLVFETIEIRAFFFPAAPDNMRGFKIVTNTNVRFRYRSNYITAPDLIQLNQE